MVAARKSARKTRKPAKAKLIALPGVSKKFRPATLRKALKKHAGRKVRRSR
jgi:hypothetical protein